jgi:molybdopterin-guanine dinucleotide biosynthesis protein A
MTDVENKGELVGATRVVGVVLAGGRSARMGQSKAALNVGGEPLLARVVGRLRRAAPDVVVVGQPELQSLVPGVPVIPDLRPGLGPLSGLESALTAVAAADATHALVVACDMPFVSPPLIQHMATLAEAQPTAQVVIPRAAHGLEYLHALYAVDCLPAIRARLDSGERSLRGLLDGLRVREIGEAEAAAYDPAGLSAFNANTPDEWRRALSLAGEFDGR